MLYREIIAFCSQIHTKHINTVCGKNVEMLSVKPGGTYVVTTGFQKAIIFLSSTTVGAATVQSARLDLVLGCPGFDS
jgi:hypothetical protein